MSVTIQLRGDTVANWTSANPILAQREPGFETDTGLYKIGDGVTAWSALPYAGLRGLDEAMVLDFEGTGEPAAPAAGHLAVYAREIAGRMLLRQKGPSGIAVPLQPSFFQNNITFFGVNVTTTLSSTGGGVTSVGTISTPLATEQYGLMSNIASAATANAVAAAGSTALAFFRGSLAGGASGFFYSARVAFPDSSYDELGAGTGARAFLGMSVANVGNALGTTASDTLGVNTIGFVRRHTNGGALDGNWRLQSRGSGAPITDIDIGLPFLPGKVYDAYLFCPPLGSQIGWRIDNLTDGIITAGAVSANLPDGSAAMRSQVMVATANAVVRNIRLQRVYVESDR